MYFFNQEFESDSSYFKPKSSRKEKKGKNKKEILHKDTSYQGLIPDSAKYCETTNSKNLTLSKSKNSFYSDSYDQTNLKNKKVSIM